MMKFANRLNAILKEKNLTAYKPLIGNYVPPRKWPTSRFQWPPLTVKLSDCGPNRPQHAVFQNAARKAAEGAEKTKTMVAKHGRPKCVGDKSLGFVDPGAVSTAFIFDTIADYNMSNR